MKLHLYNNNYIVKLQAFGYLAQAHRVITSERKEVLMETQGYINL